MLDIGLESRLRLDGKQPHHLESWVSGLNHLPAKKAIEISVRGFESLTLRHMSPSTWIGSWFKSNRRLHILLITLLVEQ